jgi:DNA-binding LacI/PurR family transcriptional regulator
MSTIIDIAKRLNISKSTVSRALSDSPGVSEKTKKLIKQTAIEMNYTVNRMAQNLADRQTRTIGFMIPDIADDFYSPMAISTENILENAGYTVSYMNMQRATGRAYWFLKRAEENRWDGIFITLDDWDDSICQKLLTMRVPIISLRRKVPSDLGLDIPYVDSDRSEGVERGINYLISLQHKNIMFIGFESLVGIEAIDAYKRYMKKLGLKEFVSSNYFYQDKILRIQQGYTSTRLLYEKHPEITAIFAGNDYLALGAMQYFQEKGISIPGDVSILGYDDREVSGLFCTQLSTIRHQLHIIGERAGELMLQMVRNKGEKIAYPNIKIPTTLCVRQTTGICKTRE